MRIAHVVATFPPDIGGMGNVALAEAEALAARGHAVTVFCLAYPGSDYGSDKTLSFVVQRVPSTLLSGNAGFAPSLYGRLQGFDIVHLHYPFYGGAEFVWWRAFFKKQKYVVTYHMDAVPQKLVQRMVQKFYDATMASLVFADAQSVFYVDAEQSKKLHFVKRIATAKLHCLPNPIDTTIFSPQQVTVSNFALDDLHDKKVFLFVGNLMPVKGFDLLLKTWAGSVPSDAVLLVVGSGYEERYYRRLVETLNVQEKVRFLGSCYDRLRLAEYYSLALATIVPSAAESFSLVAAEAAACGSVVIGSDIPGIRGRVQHGKTGFLFVPGNAQSLAEMINKVLTMSIEERKAMGAAGREYVASHFSLEKHVSDLVQLYSAVI